MRVHEIARAAGVPSALAKGTLASIGHQTKSASSKVTLLPIEHEALVSTLTCGYGPVMYTDPETRCPATRTSLYRERIQCSLDNHAAGGHYNHWTRTAWARQD